MRSRRNGASLKQHLLLFGRFLRHPNTVGAIAPSSPVLARAMITDINFRGAVRIVELGPGTGSFTRAILERIGPLTRFVAIELDAKFADEVRRQWPTIECVNASAETLSSIARERDLVPIDHVVSGLPFASLPGRLTQQILDGLRDTLRPGGTFTTFQYLHSYRLRPAGIFRRTATEHFGAPPERRVVWRNLPPAFVLSWRKR